MHREIRGGRSDRLRRRVKCLIWARCVLTGNAVPTTFRSVEI
jgi:hypothetical protein